MRNELTYRPMSEADSRDVVALIERAMNADEARWAEKTLRFHFFCQSHDEDDGRRYYVTIHEGEIVAITGTHRYIWGPEDITWGGWLAVEPALQSKGVGLFSCMELAKKLKEQGYRRIFIETYDSPEFDRARAAYEVYGFERCGSVSSYLSRGVDMIVYGMDVADMPTES